MSFNNKMKFAATEWNAGLMRNWLPVWSNHIFANCSVFAQIQFAVLKLGAVELKNSPIVKRGNRLPIWYTRPWCADRIHKAGLLASLFHCVPPSLWETEYVHSHCNPNQLQRQPNIWRVYPALYRAVSIKKMTIYHFNFSYPKKIVLLKTAEIIMQPQYIHV